MRLIAISIGTLALLGIIAATIFFWGMGRVFPKYDHPFLNHSKPILVLPWSFHESLQNFPEAILWADVYATKSDTLLVAPWGEKYVLQKNENDTATDSRPLLVDFLRQNSQRKIILNIVSNTVNIDAQVLSAAKEMIEKKNIAMQSEFDIILRAMKDSSADLPYGSSQSDRLRFNTFQSLAPWPGGLLPAVSFRGDFYLAPLLWRKIPMMSPEISAEIHRRQKLLILGPISSEQELEQAKGLGADGFLLENESLLNKFSTAHVAH